MAVSRKFRMASYNDAVSVSRVDHGNPVCSSRQAQNRKSAISPPENIRLPHTGGNQTRFLTTICQWERPHDSLVELDNGPS
jgi:hypothetical protein